MREIAMSGAYQQQHWGDGPYDYNFRGTLKLNTDGVFEGQISDLGTEDYPPLDANPIPVRGILNKAGMTLLKIYPRTPPVIYRGDRVLPVYGKLKIKPSPENSRHVDFGGHYSFFNKSVTEEDFTGEQLTKQLEKRFDDILEVLGQRQEQTSAIWGMSGMPGVVTKSKRVIVLYRVGELHILDDWAGGGFDLSLLDINESELPEPSPEIQRKVDQIRTMLPTK